MQRKTNFAILFHSELEKNMDRLSENSRNLFGKLYNFCRRLFSYPFPFKKGVFIHFDAFVCKWQIKMFNKNHQKNNNNA